VSISLTHAERIANILRRSGSRTSLSASVRSTLNLSGVTPKAVRASCSGGQGCPRSDQLSNPKKLIDEPELLFYYHFNTGKEVIKKYMSSNHSEVAET